MKRNYSTLMILGLVTLLFLSSCTKNVEQQSEKFIKCLNKQDAEAIKDISISAFEDEIVANAKDFYDEFGEIEDYELKGSEDVPYIVDGREYEDQNETIVMYKCKTSKNDAEVYIILGFIHEGGDPDADVFMTKMVYSTEELF